MESLTSKIQKAKKRLPIKLSVVEERSPKGRKSTAVRCGLDSEKLLDAKEKDATDSPQQISECLSLYDNVTDTTSPVQIRTRLKNSKKAPIATKDETNL